MQKVMCELCPRRCALAEGQCGACGARMAQDGHVVAVRPGALSAVHLDPVEKKPLHHYLPGTKTLSLGGFGCNLMCRGCQNASISRRSSLDVGTDEVDFLSPETLVEMARQQGAQSIAYTYNEPLVWWEFADETAVLAHARGLKNIMVTAGYVSPDMLEKVFAHIDAVNVDLKGFSEEFYQTWANGTLRPVLDTIEYLHHCPHVWLELTTLIIPGQNDGRCMLESEFAWIVEHLGEDVPLHLSAFFPAWHAQEIASTPCETLWMARDLARKAGLKYVYLGNVMEPNDTICPECGARVIRRMGYRTDRAGLDGERCRACSARIPGVFEG